jgi:hypothetical protein
VSKHRWKWAALVVPMLIVSLILAGGAAWADPASDLSEAESRAANAQAEVGAAEQQLDAARAEYAAAARRAEPLAGAARAAGAGARILRARLLDRQQQARADIAELEAAHQEEQNDHEDEVAAGIGLGLAALVAAGIALAWAWVRTSPAVTALVRLQLGQAVALCVGGGFLLVVVGAALSGGGELPGGLGMLLFCLGFILPVALLLGRHSAKIERGEGEPALGRERLPRWVARGAAVLLLLLGIGALGTAILADEPAATSVSSQLREDAKALESGPGADRLVKAKAGATAARKRAGGPIAHMQASRGELRRANRALRAAENRLIGVEGDRRRAARRLVALEAREEREAAREAERAEREAEEAEEEEAISGCDPNYSGCVPAYPPDVDCAEVGETVSVYGSDPHGLDADGDGSGCE